MPIDGDPAPRRPSVLSNFSGHQTLMKQITKFRHGRKLDQQNPRWASEELEIQWSMKRRPRNFFPSYLMSSIYDVPVKVGAAVRLIILLQ